MTEHKYTNILIACISFYVFQVNLKFEFPALTGRSSTVVQYKPAQAYSAVNSAVNSASPAARGTIYRLAIAALQPGAERRAHRRYSRRRRPTSAVRRLRTLPRPAVGQRPGLLQLPVRRRQAARLVQAGRGYRVPRGPRRCRSWTTAAQRPGSYDYRNTGCSKWRTQ